MSQSKCYRKDSHSALSIHRLNEQVRLMNRLVTWLTYLIIYPVPIQNLRRVCMNTHGYRIGEFFDQI